MKEAEMAELLTENVSPACFRWERRAVSTLTLLIFLHARVHTLYQSFGLKRLVNPKALFSVFCFPLWDVVHRTDANVFE